MNAQVYNLVVFCFPLARGLASVLRGQDLERCVLMETQLVGHESEASK